MRHPAAAATRPSERTPPARAPATIPIPCCRLQPHFNPRRSARAQPAARRAQGRTAAGGAALQTLTQWSLQPWRSRACSLWTVRRLWPLAQSLVPRRARRVLDAPPPGCPRAAASVAVGRRQSAAAASGASHRAASRQHPRAELWHIRPCCSCRSPAPWSRKTS